MQKIELGGIKTRLEEATSRASSVAKSFKGLDQMADDDEYLKSEGLNVKKRGNLTFKHQMINNDQGNQATALKSEEVTNSMLKSFSHNSKNITSSPKLSLSYDHANQKPVEKIHDDERLPSIQMAQDEKHLLCYQPHCYMHESVAALMEVNTQNEARGQNQKRTKKQENESESISFDEKVKNSAIGLLDSLDDFSDEDFDDPVINIMKSRISEKRKFNEEDIIMKTDDNCRKNESHILVSEKKDPNRFITDLDARLPFDQVDNFENNKQKTELPLSSRQSVSNLSGSFVKSERKLDWLRNMVSSEVNLITRIMPLLSTHYKNGEVNSLEKQDKTEVEDFVEEESITIVSSSLHLDKNEIMELERLQQKNGYLKVAIYTILGNRYLLYIFIPLLLTIIVYFITRKKTNDSVT